MPYSRRARHLRADDDQHIEWSVRPMARDRYRWVTEGQEVEFSIRKLCLE